MSGWFCKIPPEAPFLDPFSSTTMSDFKFVLIKSMISRGGFVLPLDHPPATKILAESNAYVLVITIIIN